MSRWFDMREATEAGTTLARKLLGERERAALARGTPPDASQVVRRFLKTVAADTEALHLNVLQRAKLAHAFKWSLLESGADRTLADEYTQVLVTRLTRPHEAPGPVAASPPAAAPLKSVDVAALRQRGMESLAREAFAEAARDLRAVVNREPGDAAARNNLGVALLRLGRYPEAEAQFRRAIKLNESSADAHANLGSLLNARGLYDQAEGALRRALEHSPAHLEAQLTLAAVLMQVGRWPEGAALVERVLRVAPRSVPALTLQAQCARAEGRLTQAEAGFRRALEVDPRASSAWAGLAGLRRLTHADAGWLARAEELVAAKLPPLHEAELRYAMGKYCDDTGDYPQAFRNYRRANELQKSAALRYDRDAQARLVKELKSAYGALPPAAPVAGPSGSELPVLVVGMPRSGTSLVEQIIASHPQARGAGELGFWTAATQRLGAAARTGAPDAEQRDRLATDYVRMLASVAPKAARVVDKANFNAQYLGLIHTVLPRARFVYLARDPVDSCLSCYFTQLPQEMTFAMDLADLAHYYREHQRLVEHWRTVLPPGTLLTVPYAGLVGDPEAWSRRIIEFVGLPWDPRVLEFHRTERAVRTASYWQVRQPIFASSLGRRRHYEKYLGALKGLHDRHA